VIIVDDGSDNETRALYEAYPQAKLVQLERADDKARTPSNARNRGAKEATGDFICFLDSDNYYESKFISSLIKQDVDVAFCDWEIAGLDTQRIEINRIWDFKKPMLENYLKFQHLDHQCLLMRKSYYDQAGEYDTRLPRSQDCDMIVRLILQGGVFKHMPIKLFTFEKHESDQAKTVASVYGKTLWTLKNNINICWLAQGWLNTPHNILSFHKAITDFRQSDLWAAEYDKSEFKKIVEIHGTMLYNENREKVANGKS
jgi:glycosyltransferase involved in cell wall biosynthesis